jgi:hypothetical protein
VAATPGAVKYVQPIPVIGPDWNPAAVISAPVIRYTDLSNRKLGIGALALPELAFSAKGGH